MGATVDSARERQSAEPRKLTRRQETPPYPVACDFEKVSVAIVVESHLPPLERLVDCVDTEPSPLAEIEVSPKYHFNRVLYAGPVPKLSPRTSWTPHVLIAYVRVPFLDPDN